MSEPSDPWLCHASTFRVLGAQITAVPESSEMLVETGLKLLVTEGRQEALRDDDKGQPAPSVLEYFCRVTLEGAEEPQAWTGEDAQIVITGLHENGFQITIAGPGVFGRDDKGSLEMEFEAMPQMKVWGTASDGFT
jgi:hypothetical protein